ncbi:MAG: molybdopterin molybdotransferase MoeA [Ferruginibacter sp.]
MINYQEAQRQILLFTKILKNETISLDEAYGRVLAETVTADRDYPPFNRATMDGYAINCKDYDSGTREYNIASTIYAGQENTVTLLPGECYKIMTGAAVPLQADIIIKKEDAGTTDKKIIIKTNSCKAFQNIARQGEDIKAGSIIIDENKRCTPAVMSLLAALGKHKVEVKQFPFISIFTTGNEIVPIEKTGVSTVQIRNSNQYLLKALLKEWNIIPQVCTHIPDDRAALKLAFTNALASDIVIINGGISAGDTDYVAETLIGIGVKMIFHKVAIRPGKPFWCGVMPNGGLAFALPGNPFSCMVTFNLFVKPYLTACFGLLPQPFLKLPLIDSRIKKTSLDDFFPVQVQPDPASLKALHFNTSGDIKATIFADGIALHPSQIDMLEKDVLVDYLSFGNSAF